MVRIWSHRASYESQVGVLRTPLGEKVLMLKWKRPKELRITAETRGRGHMNERETEYLSSLFPVLPGMCFLFYAPWTHHGAYGVPLG